MILLAELSWFGTVLILTVAGWLVLRLVGGQKHPQGQEPCRRGGGFLRMLGLVAIVGGIALFLVRNDRHSDVEPVPAVSEVSEVDVFADFAPGVDFRPVLPAGERTSRHPDRWVFITLGAGLVILGALLFGRGGTRPVAVKAVTLLGVGAILYAVVTFFGEPPRRFRQRDVAIAVAVPREPRSSHALRPMSRPERPRSGDRSGDRPSEALPARAGEIPVAAELARQAVAQEQPQPSAAPPSVPEEPAPPAEPQPAQPPEPPAETAAAEAPAPPAPADDPKPAEPSAAVEESKPVEPSKPVEESRPVEPSKPAEESKPIEESKPVERTKPLKEAKPSRAKKPAAADPVPAVAGADEPRPGWIEASPGLSADGVYAMPVHSGVFASVPECQRELERAIKQAADHYIEEYLGDGSSAVVNIPLSYLNEHVKKAEYAEVVHSETVGQMHQIHARLEFDNRVRAELHRRQRSAEVANRLWYTGGGAALVLALLATFYGYLKLDLHTGGAHKGRLQLAATLAALIVAAGALLVRWAVPF